MNGSRADGTVELAYDYGLFQKPQVDDAQGVDLAAATCAGWGYAASDAFGGEMTKCEAVNGNGGCIRWLVSRRYQCLGAPGSSTTTQSERPSPATPGPPPATGVAETTSNVPNATAAPSSRLPVVNPNVPNPTAPPPSFENF